MIYPRHRKAVAASIAVLFCLAGLIAGSHGQVALASDPDLRDAPAAPSRPKPRPKARRPRPSPPPPEETSEPAESPENNSQPATTAASGGPSALQPPPQAPDAVLMNRALGAYQAGRLAGPPGDNAIELARLASQLAPGNSAAALLEARACAALEKQARDAVSRQNKESAVRIYERLAELYPGRGFYLHQAKALRPPTIVGVWRWRGTLIISANFTTRFQIDGTCHMDGGLFGEVNQSGTWVCVDPKRRVFVARWNVGTSDTVTLSEDGQELEGRSNLGVRVRARRVSGP